MDFIKTSSLRALIELTFQRNWNGLIWMSRKGVITKRVKTVQTALSRISAQPRSPAGRETNCFTLGQIIRPSEVSAKVQTDRPITITTRETLSRGRPSTTLTPRRARPCRASREQASRPRNPSRTTADASVRAGKTSHVRPRNHRPNLIRPTTPADRIHPATTVPIAHDPTVRPIVPTDRPNAAVD
ncbi:unnamed protein product [Microthlaspi erraticum]|uniref:Uncharacterized protein n=1 Tax=Microthlaspi erraticum TaxID=1685480 RepID=A0A6D2JEW7_9BRAS|nr:unnamed protein product [Microthlaspi erraticum]